MGPGHELLFLNSFGCVSSRNLSPLSYTWRHPCGSKKLAWAISGYTEEFFNELKSDDFKIIQLEEDKLVGWVSFLDGMQRILLFTEDVNLCYKVSETILQTLEDSESFFDKNSNPKSSKSIYNSHNLSTYPEDGAFKRTE